MMMAARAARIKLNGSEVGSCDRGGAAIGGGISKSKENEARERIWADCLNGRGYKAYTSK